MTVRLKAAAFQNRIQDADCGGRFELELLSGFITKPQGKPTLVPESDKRPALNTAKDDFSEE